VHALNDVHRQMYIVGRPPGGIPDQIHKMKQRTTGTRVLSSRRISQSRDLPVKSDEIYRSDGPQPDAFDWRITASQFGRLSA
jgi:hypothetical protein